MAIRLSDIPDIDATGKTEIVKSKGIRLSDIPNTPAPDNGGLISNLLGTSPDELARKQKWIKSGLLKTGEDVYREGIAPIFHGASTLAFGIPKATVVTEGNAEDVNFPASKELIFPEQKTFLGKALRGGSELVGLVGGGAAKTALRVGGKLVSRKVGEGLMRRVGRSALEGGVMGLAQAPDTSLEEGMPKRLEQARDWAIFGGALPFAGQVASGAGKVVKGAISKSGRWIAKNIGGITDATVEAINRLGADRVFEPLKAKADYISQNLAPRIFNKLSEFSSKANQAYSRALDAAPEGKKINVRPAIDEAGNTLKSLGLITDTGNLTELGSSEIARDSVYGKLLDFYKSADAISGVKGLQGKDLTQAQIIKAAQAGRETLVNKKQFTFLRDKLNSLYKGKPSDIDVSGIVDRFYQAGEDSGIKGLQEARSMQRRVFDIEDKIDLNKITRDLVKAKNPQWSKVVRKEYEALADKGIMSKEELNNIMDDLTAHFANIDFDLVSETPGAGGGVYPSRSGLVRGFIGKAAKSYYKDIAPFMGKAVNRMAEGASQAKEQLNASTLGNQFQKTMQSRRGTFGMSKATGFQGAKNKFISNVDGKPRFEIDDSGATLNLDKIQKSLPLVSPQEGTLATMKMSDILNHDELYKNYPWAKNIPVEISAHPEGRVGDASTYVESGKIIIDGGIKALSPANKETLKASLLHEIQHNIQKFEGVPMGSSVGHYPAEEHPVIGAKLKKIDAIQHQIQDTINAIEDGSKSKSSIVRFNYNGKERAVPGSKLQNWFDKLQDRYDELVVDARNSKEAYEWYLGRPGEAEARAVKERMNLSREERLRVKPSIQK